jgi:hypothetical protein
MMPWEEYAAAGYGDKPAKADPKADRAQFAAAASAATGVPEEAILAHVSLETGRDGSKTVGAYNFGNIKAGNKWQGETEALSALEYGKDGKAYREPSKFRSYSDPEQAAKDYADLIRRRYPQAAQARTVEEFAQGLKAGGYATDPDYVRKLVSVAGQRVGTERGRATNRSSAETAPAKMPWEEYAAAGYTSSPQQAKPDRGLAGMAGDLAAGAVRGAGSIGATLLSPIDAAARKLNGGRPVNLMIPGTDVGFEFGGDRRQGMTDELGTLGADTDSRSFAVGKFAGEAAGTAGAGGALANGARAVLPAAMAARAAPLLSAIETGGIGGGVSLPTRMAGGAIAGGAMGAMIDPREAGGGAVAGAVLPGALGLAGRALARPAATAVDRARGIVAPPGLSTEDMGPIRQALYGSLGGRGQRGPAQVAAEARAAMAGGASSPAADDAVNGAIGALQRETGVPVALSPAALAGLKQQVTAAMAKGQQLDAAALLRQRLISDTLGADAAGTVGQITRDPMQFAQELNLRGIVGVGEPMQARMQAQNRALIGAVRGDAPLPDAYDAGAAALSSLREIDKTKAREVSAAYGKFRDSGQGIAEIPFQRVAGRYAEVLDDFGVENIPSAIQRRVGQYFGPDGAQIKPFTLDEANKLLTQINAHYDPTKPAQQAALARIKSAVQEGVEGLDDGAGSPLLKAAIAKARERFKLHDALPALKDVSRQDGGAQERFIRDYVMGGSVDQVKALAQTLPPDVLADVRGALRRQILDAAAPGASEGRETAAISQAALRRAIDKIGTRKMQLIFGDDAAKLASVQQVAEWVMKEPAGAAVNRSNTAGAVANLLQAQLPGSIPGVLLKKGREVLQTAEQNRSASSALAGAAPSSALRVSPAEVAAMRDKLGTGSEALNRVLLASLLDEQRGANARSTTGPRRGLLD